MTRPSLSICLTSICVLAVILSIGSLQRSFAGASFTVDTTADELDNTPGDGTCGSLAARCSLRAAVQEANALPGADTIVLPAGTYVLTLAGALEDAAVTGDLDVSDDVTIIGAGAQQTVIDGARQDRVLHVDESVVQLLGLTIRNGLASADLHGGGIFNGGTLTVRRERGQRQRGQPGRRSRRRGL